MILTSLSRKFREMDGSAAQSIWSKTFELKLVYIYFQLILYCGFNWRYSRFRTKMPKLAWQDCSFHCQYLIMWTRHHSHQSGCMLYFYAQNAGILWIEGPRRCLCFQVFQIWRTDLFFSCCLMGNSWMLELTELWIKVWEFGKNLILSLI